MPFFFRRWERNALNSACSRGERVATLFFTSSMLTSKAYLQRQRASTTGPPRDVLLSDFGFPNFGLRSPPFLVSCFPDSAFRVSLSFLFSCFPDFSIHRLRRVTQILRQPVSSRRAPRPRRFLYAEKNFPFIRCSEFDVQRSTFSVFQPFSLSVFQIFSISAFSPNRLRLSTLDLRRLSTFVSFSNFSFQLSAFPWHAIASERRRQLFPKRLFLQFQLSVFSFSKRP